MLADALDRNQGNNDSMKDKTSIPVSAIILWVAVFTLISFIAGVVVGMGMR